MLSENNNTAYQSARQHSYSPPYLCTFLQPCPFITFKMCWTVMGRPERKYVFPSTYKSIYRTKVKGTVVPKNRGLSHKILNVTQHLYNNLS